MGFGESQNWKVAIKIELVGVKFTLSIQECKNVDEY